MTISFLDFQHDGPPMSTKDVGRDSRVSKNFQHVQQSSLVAIPSALDMSSVREAAEPDDDKNPSFVQICERESSCYSFSEWPPVPGFITGKGLFDKILQLMPEVK